MARQRWKSELWERRSRGFQRKVSIRPCLQFKASRTAESNGDIYHGRRIDCRRSLLGSLATVHFYLANAGNITSLDTQINRNVGVGHVLFNPRHDLIGAVIPLRNDVDPALGGFGAAIGATALGTVRFKRGV